MWPKNASSVHHNHRKTDIKIISRDEGKIFDHIQHIPSIKILNEPGRNRKKLSVVKGIYIKHAANTILEVKEWVLSH